MSNIILSDVPSSIPDEIFNDIIATENVRIERILSHGHSSPEQGWYDQDENEWVMVLEGQGVIEFEDGRVTTNAKGITSILPYLRNLGSWNRQRRRNYLASRVYRALSLLNSKMENQQDMKGCVVKFRIKLPT